MDGLIPRMLCLNIVACKGVLIHSFTSTDPSAGGVGSGDVDVMSSWDGNATTLDASTTDNNNNCSHYNKKRDMMVQIHVNFKGQIQRSSDFIFHNDMVFNYSVSFPFAQPFHPRDVIQIYLTSSGRMNNSSNNNYIGCTVIKEIIGMSVIEIGTLLDMGGLHFQSTAGIAHDNDEENEDMEGDFECDHYLSAEIFSPYETHPSSYLPSVGGADGASATSSDLTVLNGIIFVKPKITKFPYFSHVSGTANVGADTTKMLLYGDIISYQKNQQQQLHRQTSDGTSSEDTSSLQAAVLLQEFFHNSTVWYNKLLKQYPYLLHSEHQPRAIKLFARDEMAQFHCVCDFVCPIASPSAIQLSTPTQNEISLHLARFVSLLPNRGELKVTKEDRARQATAILLGTVDVDGIAGGSSDGHKSTTINNTTRRNYYQSYHALFSTMQCNGPMDYCHLLCSLLLGCSPPSTHVYIACGSIKVRTGVNNTDGGAVVIKPYNWVVTIEDELSGSSNNSSANKATTTATTAASASTTTTTTGKMTKKIVFWDAMTGTQVRVVDTGSAVTTFQALNNKKTVVASTNISNNNNSTASGSPWFHELYALYNHRHFYINIQKRPAVAMHASDVSDSNAASSNTGGATAKTSLYSAFHNLHESFVSYDLNNSHFWVLFPVQYSTSTSSRSSSSSSNGGGASTITRNGPYSAFRASNALTLRELSTRVMLTNRQVLGLTGNISYQLPFQLLLQEQYYDYISNRTGDCAFSCGMADAGSGVYSNGNNDNNYDDRVTYASALPGYTQYHCSVPQLERYITNHLKHAITRWREDDYWTNNSYGNRDHDGGEDAITTLFDDGLSELLQVSYDVIILVDDCVHLAFLFICSPHCYWFFYYLFSVIVFILLGGAEKL